MLGVHADEHQPTPAEPLPLTFLPWTVENVYPGLPVRTPRRIRARNKQWQYFQEDPSAPGGCVWKRMPSDLQAMLFALFKRNSELAEDPTLSHSRPTSCDER